MKFPVRSALLAVFLGSFCMLATARAIDEPAMRTVNFADLDLSHGAGVAALYARIRTAAREVCGQPDTRQLQAYMSSRRCTEQAVARAVHDANAPRLISYHLAKSEPTLALARR